jgi:hypothetical protein
MIKSGQRGRWLARRLGILLLVVTGLFTVAMIALSSILALRP